MCNQEAQKEDSLQCNTCNQWCHFTCTAESENNQQRNESFQWICPTLNCSPNHGLSTHQTILISPNRYRRLEEINLEQPPHQQKMNKPRKQKQNIQISHEINLNNELPKISSKDFIGKDLCTNCFKEVKYGQQAISCDLCERWTHRICSDMNTQYYNQCKKKKHFIWFCNKCRKDEYLNTDKLDLTKLKETDVPESYTKSKQ